MPFPITNRVVLLMARAHIALPFILAAVAVVPPASAGTIPTGVFDWNPRPLGLDGRKLRADAVQLSDYGRVTMDPLSGAFSDVGIMPILGFSLGGQPVAADGFNDPSGGGWGAYVAYEGVGSQAASPQGLVATYSALTYLIYGFNGLASYGLDQTGSPYVAGGTDLTLLGRGSLIGGALTMYPAVFEDGQPVAFGVQGGISTTIEDVPRQFSSNTFLGFDLALVHQPGEFFPVSPTVFVANGGSSSTATLIASRGNSAHGFRAAVADAGVEGGAMAATAVPEPGSAALVAGALGMLGMLARRRRGG